MKPLPNVHPGEVLLEEFLKPSGISQNRAARDTCVPPRRVNEIVHGKRGVSADTALRLARYFGTSERFWMGLQADYDLEEARRALVRWVTNTFTFALRLFAAGGVAPPPVGPTTARRTRLASDANALPQRQSYLRPSTLGGRLDSEVGLWAG